MIHINKNKLDLFGVIFDNFEELRVSLNPIILKTIRNKAFKKFGSINKLAKRIKPEKNKQYYSPLQRYLTNYKYRTSIPIKILKDLILLLDISNEELYKNIEYFQAWAGKKINLPRYIKIDNDFIYGIGLYLGEGKNSDKKKQRIGIANSKKEINLFSIYWFTKYFNIPKEDLRFFATVPQRYSKLKIRRLLKKDYNANNISLSKNKRANIAAIQVYYDSVVLRRIIDWAKENIIHIILEKKELGISFLQGIFDGEGSVGIDKKRRTVKLNLEMKNPLVLDIIRHILYQNKIDSTKSNSNKFLISTATRDYFKIKEMSPFRFNLKNKKKFLDGEKIVKRLQTFKGGLFYELLEYMQFNCNQGFKLDELYSFIGRKGRANVQFRLAINRALNLNFIEREGEGTRLDPYSHKITEKGIEYINNEKTLKINQFDCLKSNICKIISGRWENGS